MGHATRASLHRRGAVEGEPGHAPIPAQRAKPAPAVHLRGLRLALLAHVLVRGISLAVLWLTAQLTDSSAYHALTRWDAAWYRRIAESGYGHVGAASDGRTLSDYAFFPLYPMAERALATVTGLPPVEAGLVISACASVVAAAGIYRVGECLHDAKVGVILVCLWSALPVSLVQSMAYTESLFTAFAAWGLYALLRDRFVIAGVMAAMAGLTRPMGVAVVAAVLAAVALRIARPRSGHPEPPVARAAVRGPVLGAVLAPLGVVSYLAYVGWSHDSPVAYLEVAQQWGNGVDGGQHLAAWTAGMVSSDRVAVGLLLVLGFGLLGVAVWHTATHGYPWPVFVYTVTAVLLSMSTAGYFGSRPRYLLPVFTLLLWPALLTARLERRQLIIVLTGLSVASAGYGTAWLLGPGPP